MTDPPNIYKIIPKTYQSQLGEPKFIIIKRKEKIFRKKKSVEFACEEEVEEC